MESRARRTNICNKFVSLDVYGKPVQLTFMGKEKFKTNIGACISITVAVILLLFTIFNLAKINILSEPQSSTMHERSFYQKNSLLDANEIVKPGQVFAMSLGGALVDPKIGSFVVKQEYRDKNSPALSSSDELTVVPCVDTSYKALFTHLPDYEAMYCLSDYADYRIKGDRAEEEHYFLLIQFEVCRNQPTCVANAES